MKKRSTFSGSTDFTAVSLQDIIAHLGNWKTTTDSAILVLRERLDLLHDNKDKFQNPMQVESFICYFLDAYERYSLEFERLIREIPAGVTQAHAETVRQIHRDSAGRDNLCRSLRDGDFTYDDKMRLKLIEKVYEETRSQIEDYRDLSNLATRLDALVGTKLAKPWWHLLFGSAWKCLLWVFGTIIAPILCAWLIKRLRLG